MRLHVSNSHELDPFIGRVNEMVSVAQHHSLNANLVHKWIRVQTNKALELQPAFIPLPLQLDGGHSQATSLSICVEIQHSRGAVKVNWPTESAAACASFLRELLR